jgi:glycosyltransferase involved in cell wall biosynthesis
MVVHKKRILFISPSDITEDSRILKQISVAYSEGFKVLALGVKNQRRIHSNPNKDIISFNLHTKKLNLKLNNSVIKLFISSIKATFMTVEVSLKFIPKMINFKPSIVHCSDYIFLPLAVTIKFLTKAKIIYDVHELESQTNSISKLTSSYVLSLEKLVWPSIDLSLHVSESIRDWYLENVGAHSSEIIFNSPVIKRLEPKSSYFRDVYKIPSDVKIFLYLGILGRGRGIETALKIFSTLESSAAIIFMGQGDREEQIKDFSKKFSNIFIHSPVLHDDIASVASSADFGYCVIENASLSDYFCLPNKLFEYAFSGIPVLASKFPDISKVVDGFNLGILTDIDEKSIRKGIKELVDSEGNHKFFAKDLYPLSWIYQSEKLRLALNNLSLD